MLLYLCSLKRNENKHSEHENLRLHPFCKYHDQIYYCKPSGYHQPKLFLFRHFAPSVLRVFNLLILLGHHGRWIAPFIVGRKHCLVATWAFLKKLSGFFLKRQLKPKGLVGWLKWWGLFTCGIWSLLLVKSVSYRISRRVNDSRHQRTTG